MTLSFLSSLLHPNCLSVTFISSFCDFFFFSDSRYQWNGLWRRDFTLGTVLVNEPGASTKSNLAVPSGGTYKDIKGVGISTVTLAARNGKVLVLQNPPPATPTVSANPTTTPSQCGTNHYFFHFFNSSLTLEVRRWAHNFVPHESSCHDSSDGLVFGDCPLLAVPCPVHYPR